MNILSEELSIFRSALDWDGFTSFWREAYQDVRRTVSNTIQETSTEFVDNLTGRDGSDANEALQRMRDFAERHRNAPEVQVPEQKAPEVETEIEMMEREFREELAENYDELGNLDYTQDYTMEELEEGIIDDKQREALENIVDEYTVRR